MSSVDGEEMAGWRPAPGALCAKCGTRPVGPGGIIYSGCGAAIEAANLAIARRAAGGRES
jgi:hypothetical protein